MPPNVGPGDKLVIRVGSPAREYEVSVPEGCMPGSLLNVEVPIDAEPQPRYHRHHGRYNQTQRSRQREQQDEVRQYSNQSHQNRHNHHTSSYEPQQRPNRRSHPLPWVDIVLLAEESAIGAWVYVDLFEPDLAGGAHKRITERPHREQIRMQQGEIRVRASIPSAASSVVVRIQSDELETLNATASVGTKVYLRVKRRQQAHELAQSAGGAGEMKDMSSESATSGARPRKVARRYSIESDKRIDQLILLSKKVDTIEQKIEGFQKAVNEGTASGAQLSVIQDALAQLYGNLEKLQFNEIDAVVTGDLTSGRVDAKQRRKALSKRTSQMLSEVERLVKEIKRRRGKQ